MGSFLPPLGASIYNKVLCGIKIIINHVQYRSASILSSKYSLMTFGLQNLLNDEI